MAAFDRESLAWLGEALERLGEGFGDLPDAPTALPGPSPRAVLLEVARRLHDNYPYHHPLYAGQMLKPPHPVARLAYALTLWMNPNNHALDGGRASSAMEKEAVAQLAAMVGFRRHLGHLCSGGTVANLEALWVADRLAPGRTVVASQLAHYTHERLCAVLGLPFRSVAADRCGRMDLAALESLLREGSVGTVVATLGTTGFGAVDPLHNLLELQSQHGFRLHVDAAYGGYFRLLPDLGDDTRRALAAMSAADSLVIDPHKHGLQPYGCGCVLFADPGIGRLYAHESPYTYFTSSELHLGEISLECSRPGASAVALWATQRLLPLEPGGEFAADLGRCRAAALALYRALRDSDRFRVLMAPELDVVVWGCRGESASEQSKQSLACFEAAAGAGLHLALMEVPVGLARAWWGDELRYDAETVTCLRSVLMKPEHLDCIDTMIALLERAADTALALTGTPGP